MDTQKTVPRQFFDRIYGSANQLENNQGNFYNNRKDSDTSSSEFGGENKSQPLRNTPMSSPYLLTGFASFLARRKRKEGRPRRQRTTFSGPQTLKLELEFNQNEYISRGRRFELAEILDLSESQIKIWFQNRRAKDKRIEKAQIDQQYRLLVTKFIPGTSNYSASSYQKTNFNPGFMF